MKVKRGDIYWIEQSKYRPTVGSVQRPGRPGIIVSNDANNACAYTFEVVYLTGKPKKALPTHCTITSAERTSIALCEQVQTVSDEQLREYVGHCSDAEMEQVNRCLAISLDLKDQLQELRLELRNNAVLMPGEEAHDPMKVIYDMELELAAANARVHMLTQLYNNLLDRATG